RLVALHLGLERAERLDERGIRRRTILLLGALGDGEEARHLELGGARPGIGLGLGARDERARERGEDEEEEPAPHRAPLPSSPSVMISRNSASSAWISRARSRVRRSTLER